MKTMPISLRSDEKDKLYNTKIVNDVIGKFCISKDISDGYHTFDELYEFRKVYNAALFNQWAAAGMYDVHKSVRHADGEYCFGDENWFVVVAMLPTGQITNHYKREDWDLFRIPAKDRALFEFDGHTPADVINRLKAL